MLVNQVFTIKGDKSKGTLTVFLKYLGYSLGNKPCFSLWDETDKEPQLFTPSLNWVKRTLLTAPVTKGQ